MTTLLETLTKQLAGGNLKDLASRVGADERATGTALSTALPVILGALARNASKPEGAAALHHALEKDHNGAVLDNVSNFVKSGQSSDGDAILKHVLGSKRQAVEASASKVSGMSAASMSKLMATVAPLVLGALGRQQRQSNMDAGKLANYLGEQRQAVERTSPQGMNVLSQFLDADGDGDVDLGDIAKKAAGAVGKLFNR